MKSTFFNKLAGSRVSIVEDTPGVTRDRIYFDIDWNGRPITLIDTGGIEPKTDDIILKHMRMQAQIAIETADVIIFMTDVTTGLTADDRDISLMLQKSGKPLVLAVNKVDKVGALPMEFYEFYELGIDGEPIAVSSVHGTGSGDILDRVLEIAPPEEEFEDEEDDSRIKVAVIGKPNSGKSSLVNGQACQRQGLSSVGRSLQKVTNSMPKMSAGCNMLMMRFMKEPVPSGRGRTVYSR